MNLGLDVCVFGFLGVIVKFDFLVLLCRIRLIFSGVWGSILELELEEWVCSD